MNSANGTLSLSSPFSYNSTVEKMNGHFYSNPLRRHSLIHAQHTPDSIKCTSNIHTLFDFEMTKRKFSIYKFNKMSVLVPLPVSECVSTGIVVESLSSMFYSWFSNNNNVQSHCSLCANPTYSRRFRKSKTNRFHHSHSGVFEFTQVWSEHKVNSSERALKRLDIGCVCLSVAFVCLHGIEMLFVCIRRY